MHRSYKLLVLPFLLMICVSLACNIPQTGQPTLTLPNIPANPPQATQPGTAQVAPETAKPEPTPLMVTVTQAELTEITNQALASQTDVPLENVQVQLRDNLVTITGDGKQGNFSAPVKINLTLAPTSQGKLAAKIDSAYLGILKMPQTLTQPLQTMIDEAIQTHLNSKLAGIFVQKVEITNGMITVEGHAR